MMCKPAEDYFTASGKAGSALDDCLVIDAHAHLNVLATAPNVDSTPQSLVEEMDRLGVDRAFASSTWAIFGQDRLGNDRVIEAVQRYPGRIRGYMSLNVGYPDTIVPEMERCWASGLRAVKIWSYGNRPGLPYDHPNYEIIFQYAEEKGIPILAHTWGGELDELDGAFVRYRRIRWILAHTGCRDLDKYLHAANTYDRVYLETCLSSCPRGLIERLVAEVPIHKIIWGTDQIFMSATQQLGRVLFARITSEQKRAILGENAARVLEDAADD